MGLKVCVSAGHEPNTAGKRAPDGFREFQFIYPTAQYVCQYLLEYENIQVKKVYSQNSDMPLQTRANTANSWGQISIFLYMVMPMAPEAVGIRHMELKRLFIVHLYPMLSIK